MGPGPGGFGFSPMRGQAKSNIPRPKSLREVPRWCIAVLKGFFSRLFYIVSLVWEAKPSVLIVMTLTCILDGVLPVVGAYITRDLMNNLVYAVTGDLGSFTPIVTLLIVWFAYLFFKKITARVSTMVTRIAGELVVNHIKLKIIDKAKQVDIASFDRPEFYEKLENANREAGNRPISILNATFNVISSLISAVSFVVILGSLHPLAPVLIIVMALPTAIVNYIYRNKNFQYIRHRSKDRRQMQYYSGVVVDKDRAKEVRIMNLADTFIEKYKAVFKKYYAGLRRLILHEGAWSIGLSFCSLAADCVLFLYVAYQVYQGQLEIGDYSLYTGALNSITAYVTTLISSTATIYEGTLFIDNLITFMKEEITVKARIAEPKTPMRHAPHTIEFVDVSFRYPGTTRDVIKHMNLKVKAGESVVLVGLNGAGKTTLIKLLTRLYDPTEGYITLDGVDLRDYDVKELYSIFGIIFQDFGKYAVDVRENITFGDVDKEVEEDAVRNAAHRSNSDVFIEKLPNGYDTPLMRYFEENGIELSIGQWQKLSVARAFYKDSDILILDEPTASLDPLAEAEIFSQFRELGKDKITLFVSHRLSSATQADKIIVVENGEMIEYGNHTELMSRHGRYFELFTTQASRYVTENGSGINDGTEHREPSRPFKGRGRAKVSDME